MFVKQICLSKSGGNQKRGKNMSNIVRDNIDIQRIIFNDIKDGYNTTNKLRRVYKEELSGGSFCRVKYAVDDMLRGGAIRYVEED